MEMEGKVAIVTGGTSGIGKEIVKELLEKGCRVVTCYHNNEDNADETEEECKTDKLHVFKCDVSNEAEVKNMFNFVKGKYGSVDFLVNTAGTFTDAYIKNFNMDDFREIMDINFLGTVICTKHIYEIMNPNGSIVNICSHLGVTPCKKSAAYCAAAAAKINFTKATAIEYASKKIRANSICPAFTPTPLSVKVSIFKSLFLSPVL